MHAFWHSEICYVVLERLTSREGVPSRHALARSLARAAAAAQEGAFSEACLLGGMRSQWRRALLEQACSDTADASVLHARQRAACEGAACERAACEGAASGELAWCQWRTSRSRRSIKKSSTKSWRPTPSRIVSGGERTYGGGSYGCGGSPMTGSGQSRCGGHWRGSGTPLGSSEEEACGANFTASIGRHHGRIPGSLRREYYQ